MSNTEPDFSRAAYSEGRYNDPYNLLFDGCLSYINQEGYHIVLPWDALMVSGYGRSRIYSLVHFLGDILLEGQQPQGKSNLVANLRARVMLKDVDKSEYEMRRSEMQIWIEPYPAIIPGSPQTACRASDLAKIASMQRTPISRLLDTGP